MHGALGERLKLTDKASALARADASEGIHYSFEKLDHVTCSTVHERLLTFDVATYRGELVSFSIAEASVEAAREHIELLEVAEEERRGGGHAAGTLSGDGSGRGPQHRHGQKTQQR